MANNNALQPESASNFDANRLLMLIFAHVAITLILPRLWTLFGNGIDILISFVLGVFVVSFWDMSYLRRVFWMAVYAIYLTWQIILTNIGLAWVILQPRPKLNPGIISVPLTVTTGLEITTLASSVSLTPGTLSIDLGENEDGERVLYVHTLTLEDPDIFRARIKNGFESLILRVTRD
jgi:multicomponent Na+:H+ antiporter subunit E